MSRRKRAYKRKTGPVSPESSTPAKLARSAAERQKLYREAKARLLKYPNLVRRVKEREKRLKRDPVYQTKLREEKLARRRERRRSNRTGGDGVPSKIKSIAPKGSLVRPGSLRKPVGYKDSSYVGHPRDPLKDLRPVEAMYALGLSHEQVADVMGVSSSTWRRWIEVSPSLRKTIKTGTQIADSKVVASLYKQALGYSVPEEKVFYDKVRERVVKVSTQKYVQPNTVASIFWLKNRQAEFWTDRKEIDHKGGPAGGITREVKIVLVAPSGDKSEDNQDQVIDADFRVLPALEDKSGEKSE